MQVNQELNEIRTAIKDTSKEIYSLKKDMHDEGNKLA
jgi:hypothetical protein